MSLFTISLLKGSLRNHLTDKKSRMIIYKPESAVSIDGMIEPAYAINSQHIVAIKKIDEDGEILMEFAMTNGKNYTWSLESPVDFDKLIGQVITAEGVVNY